MQPNVSANATKGIYFPPYITLAHVFNAPSGWRIGPRRFRQYQLQYVLSGEARYCIEDRHYTTKKGDLILHYPNEEHDVRTIAGVPYVCVSIVFHFGDTAFPPLDLLSGVHDMGNFENTTVESALTAIPALYHQPDSIHRLRTQSLLMEVLYTLLRTHRETQTAGAPSHAGKAKTHANIVLIRNYITEHYTEEITYKQLEQLTKWSKNYILLKFKEAYAYTPMQYQIQLRIERAKELAIQSNLSITEIAHQVGYSDIHTLGKIFKKKTGLSLSEFCSSLLY